MAAIEPNLVCANGHRFYSPTPNEFVTTNENQRFCVHERCYKRSVPVRKTDGAFLYVSPYSTNPPMGVMEEWLDSSSL